MNLLTLDAAISAASTTAERLEATLARSKCDTKISTRIKEARHTLGNLLQELVFLNQKLVRLQTEWDDASPDLQSDEPKRFRLRSRD